MNASIIQDGPYLLAKVSLIYLPLQAKFGPEYVHSVKVVTFFFLRKKNLPFKDGFIFFALPLFFFDSPNVEYLSIAICHSSAILCF